MTEEREYKGSKYRLITIKKFEYIKTMVGMFFYFDSLNDMLEAVYKIFNQAERDWEIYSGYVIYETDKEYIMNVASNTLFIVQKND